MNLFIFILFYFSIINSKEVNLSRVRTKHICIERIKNLSARPRVTDQTGSLVGAPLGSELEKSDECIQCGIEGNELLKPILGY